MSPVLQKNFNLAFFKFFIYTVEGRSLELCLITTLLGVYQVMLGVMTLTLFQDHSVSKTYIVNCRVFLIYFFRFLSRVV